MPFSFVTDYDCWKDDAPHVTLEEVIAVMKANNAKAYRIASQVIAEGQDLYPQGCVEEGLKNGLMTAEDQMRPDQREWLSVLV